jgi:hypothetical protein
MAHVTVPSDEPAVAYMATAGQTDFPITFPFFLWRDVEVYVDGVRLTAGYLVIGIPVDGGFQGGTLRFTNGRLEGSRILIRRRVVLERLTDFPYPSRTLDIRAINTEFDRVFAALVDRATTQDRALQVPPGEAAPGLVPPVALRANKLLAFDAQGNPTVLPNRGDEISRSLMAPPGEGPPGFLPAEAARANKLLSFDAQGRPTVTTLPSGDGGGGGGGLGQFLQTGWYAVSRDPYGKMGEALSVRDFGAVGDGVEDDTVAVEWAIQEAIRSGRMLEINCGVYRLTRMLVFARAPRMWGHGSEGMATNPSPFSTRGLGSWFYFDHSGIGFVFGDGNAFTTGGVYRDIGHIRNQPQPQAGVPFVANDHDFDIHLLNCDIFIDQVCLLNSSRGIRLAFGAAGRLRIGSVTGQPLITGIEVHESYDVTSFNHIHFWPMWSNAVEVVAYMIHSAVALRTGRCDGVMGTNFFVYGYKAGHQIYGWSVGTTQRAVISNAYFDLCNLGIEVDSSVGAGAANGGSDGGAIVMYENYVYSGHTLNPPGATAVGIFGKNSDISITDLESVWSSYGAVRSVGQWNRLSLNGRVSLRNWGRDTSLIWPAVEATNQDTIVISGDISFSPSASARRWSDSGNIIAPSYGASGRVEVPAGVNPAVTVTHGLGRMPKQSEIMVWPSGGFGGAAGWNVDQVGFDDFRLTVYGNTGQATFYNWKVALA